MSWDLIETLLKVKIYLHQETYFKESGKLTINMKCCDIVLFNILYFSDDGIVISISIWQCILEFCTNCLVSVCLLVFKEHSYNLLLFLQLISYCLNYMILPSFYLLADSRFRNSLYKKGIFKSIWSALKQNYERNSIEYEMKVMS